MMANADWGKDPGGVLVREVVIGVNSSCSETACLIAANWTAVRTEALVTTDGVTLRVLGIDDSCNSPRSDVVRAWMTQESKRKLFRPVEYVPTM